MESYNLGFWKPVLLVVILLATGCSSHFIATGMPTYIPTDTSQATDVPTSAIMTSTIGKIAFISDRDGKFAIYVMNADGSGLKNLTNNLDYSSEPNWSRGGQHIVFSAFQGGSTPQIYIMNADGTDQRQLTNDITGDYSPAWSPDGKYIIFLSTRDSIPSNNRGIPTPEVYLMKSDGSEQQRLTKNQDFERYLSWSSKGDEIVISANVQTTLGYDIEQIYLMGLDGVIQKQLTEIGYNEHPTWSPNGEFIAFASTQGNESRICTIKADGSDQVCLTKSVNTNSSSLYMNNLAPSWSSDGNYILFSSNRDGNYNLYMMKSDGSNLTRLTNEPSNETSPVWSLGPFGH